MASKPKCNGRNTVRLIEHACAVLGYSVEELFARAHDEDNVSKDKANRVSETDLDAIVASHARNFALLRDRGPIAVPGFEIPRFVITYAQAKLSGDSADGEPPRRHCRNGDGPIRICFALAATFHAVR